MRKENYIETFFFAKAFWCQSELKFRGKHCQTAVDKTSLKKRYSTGCIIWILWIFNNISDTKKNQFIAAVYMYYNLPTIFEIRGKLFLMLISWRIPSLVDKLVTNKLNQINSTFKIHAKLWKNSLKYLAYTLRYTGCLL